MKPSRELNKLVAERVMGLTFDAPSMNTFSQQGLPKDYSNDIVAAIEVLEKVGFRVGIRSKAWVFAFSDPTSDFTLEADSMPHAICLAALKAKGVSVD